MNKHLSFRCCYLPVFTVLLILTCSFAFGQNSTPNYTEKVKSQDSIIHNLYQVISGPKGENRDWELFRYLFLPKARLIPTGQKPDGGFGHRFLSVDDYIKTSGAWLEENGFFEKELHRKTQTYGSISQVFSTYESYKTMEDIKPFMRGINSIQLFYDGNRWWIVNIFWMSESEEFPIPEQYDKKH